jgi:hypothetical protein
MLHELPLQDIASEMRIQWPRSRSGGWADLRKVGGALSFKGGTWIGSRG